MERESLEDNNFCLLMEDNLPNETPISDFCNDCINNFIKCPLCNGYFDINKYYDHHEDKCRLIYQIYTEKENLVNCKLCNNFVKMKDFDKHKDVCVNNQTNKEKITCNFCDKSLSISLIVEHETTCMEIQSQLMLVNETVDCSFCKENFPLVHIQSHENSCQKLKEKQDEINNRLKELKIKYPKKWEQEIFSTKVIDDNLSIITLDRGGSQFKFVCDKLASSVPNVNVLNVYQIQNKYLWEKYYREKAKVKEEKGSSEVNWLFHGSRNNKPESLYTIGFDISFASDGGSFGRGIYFARQAAYSFQGYSFYKDGKGYLFLAKVITGIPYVYGHKQFGQHGRRKMNANLSKGKLNKPPLWAESKFIYYDSMTDNNNKDKNTNVSQMYVIYENNKAYPFYLIEFDASKINNLQFNYYGNQFGNMFKPIVNHIPKVKPIVNQMPNPYINNKKKK
jgi:hypothetical protein